MKKKISYNQFYDYLNDYTAKFIDNVLSDCVRPNVDDGFLEIAKFPDDGSWIEVQKVLLARLPDSVEVECGEDGDWEFSALDEAIGEYTDDDAAKAKVMACADCWPEDDECSVSINNGNCYYVGGKLDCILKSEDNCQNVIENIENSGRYQPTGKDSLEDFFHYVGMTVNEARDEARRNGDDEEWAETYAMTHVCRRAIESECGCYASRRETLHRILRFLWLNGVKEFTIG